MIYGTSSYSDYFSSVRIEANFSATKPVDNSVGTGFLIRRGKDIILVTARHVIGENHLPPGDQVGKILNQVELDFWTTKNSVTGYRACSYSIQNPIFMECPSDNDLAAAKLDFQIDPSLDLSFQSFDHSDLATDIQLKSYFPGMPVFLSGYPPISPNTSKSGNSPAPLMRQGIISSPPSLPISIPNKLGSSYSYIDSYAIGGVSGSPIIVPQLGLPPGGVIAIEPYQPKRVIGLLVGRVNSNDEGSAGQHSGLSYFVNSQAIIDLLKMF